MRTLLIVIAALAFLAAPAIAQPVLTKDVEVKLSIEAYATLRGVPTSVSIDLNKSSLAGGVLTGNVGIYCDIVCNTMPTVTATIVGDPVDPDITWSLDAPAVTATGDPAVMNLCVGVRVAVMPGTAPQTLQKQAKVTITITNPV